MNTIREKLAWTFPRGLLFLAALSAGVLACSTIMGEPRTRATAGPPTISPPGPTALAPTNAPVPPSLPDPSRTPDVEYEGVSFSFDPVLATMVLRETFPANRGGPDDPFWMFNPEYRLFTLLSYPHQDSNFAPTITVYPVNEFAEMVPEVNDLVAELRLVLETQPSEYEQALPYLPVYNAAQIVRAKIAYIGFQNGRGIRFLTQYGQAAWPINNNDLFYTFQGLSEDGRYWVSALLPVSHPGLSADGEDALGGDYDAFSERFMEYVDEMQSWLGSQNDSSFNPNLALLDELFRSLLIQ